MSICLRHFFQKEGWKKEDTFIIGGKTSFLYQVLF